MKETIELTMYGNDYIIKNWNSDGLAITTFANCWKCGKPTNGKYASQYGIHPNCEDGKSFTPKANKENHLKGLSKLPKYSNKYLEVLSHVHVKASNGKAVCTMTNLEKVKQIEILVDGDCNICVPRNTFVDVLIHLANENDYFILSQNNDVMTMEITTEDSNIQIKGIDAQEFPDVSNLPLI